MALTSREREEFLESIRLGIESCCSDESRINTLKVNMQSGDPKWARMYSQVCFSKKNKKPKSWLGIEDALVEVEKLISRVKFGYINIVIEMGLVVDVLEESQVNLWIKQ
jgi:hypothetical protein